MSNQPARAPQMQMLHTAHAAEILNVSISTLNKWRHYGTGPKYSKLGRAVRYEMSDLLEFVEQQKIANDP